MALTNTVRRGTFLPDSTDAENFKLTQLLAAGWALETAPPVESSEVMHVMESLIPIAVLGIARTTAS